MAGAWRAAIGGLLAVVLVAVNGDSSSDIEGTWNVSQWPPGADRSAPPTRTGNMTVLGKMNAFDVFIDTNYGPTRASGLYNSNTSHFFGGWFFPGSFISPGSAFGGFSYHLNGTQMSGWWSTFGRGELGYTICTKVKSAIPPSYGNVSK